MRINANLEVGNRYQIVYSNCQTTTRTLKHIESDGVLIFSGGLILDNNSDVSVKELYTKSNCKTFTGSKFRN